MLATPYHPTAPQYYQTNFLPPVPSPLSPRSANIYGRRSIFNNEPTMSENSFTAGKEPQERTVRPAYSQRAIKKAPAQSQDALKDKRRGMFLKKVREGREEKRFERMGEDIMRLDFVQRQKQWEAEQARSAPLLPFDPVEEEEAEADAFEFDFASSSNAMQISAPSTQQPEQEADDIAQREREELEALLSFLPGEQDFAAPQATTQGNDEQMSEHFGSDDDDYDALFSDFVNENAHDGPETGNQTQVSSGEGDDMDMS